MGKRFSGVEEFATTMNMESMSKTAFATLTTSIHEKCIEVLQSTLAISREKVRESHQDLVGHDQSDDVRDRSVKKIGVSYDGRCLTRGRTSKHGVGCVIDTLTGYVVDAEVMTRYCHSCEMKKGMQRRSRKIWFILGDS